MCVCIRARATFVCACVHTCSDCDGGGGGCLPVWDSEQRAGGLGMEQRICIDCFCASELFSCCQSCLHQLRGKLQHLHQEAFTFLYFFFLRKKNLSISYFTEGGASTVFGVRGCSWRFRPILNRTSKIKGVCHRVVDWITSSQSKTRQKLAFLSKSPWIRNTLSLQVISGRVRYDSLV